MRANSLLHNRPFVWSGLTASFLDGRSLSVALLALLFRPCMSLGSTWLGNENRCISYFSMSFVVACELVVAWGHGTTGP